MRICSIAASALALVGLLAGGASAQTVVSGNVTTDTTWSGTVILDGAIFVNNNATLTIEAGTIVRGQPRTAAVLAGSTVGTPGALIVTQSGTIIAEGTAAEPIIMTTAAVDNDGDGIADDDDANGFNDPWQPGDAFLDDTPTTAPLSPLNPAGTANVGLWGGLVVLGNAPTNLGNACATSSGVGTCTVEGLTVPGFPEADALYGGANAGDSSGSLTYVSVRHAGDEIGAGNELNGVTLAGVGSGTEINHIEVYCNFDDGIEWFGGTVNSDHLQVVFAGDDQFDADQGFTGTTQFMVAILPFFNEGDGSNFGSSSGDKGCECDGDDFDESPSNVRYVAGPGSSPDPLSNADFYNFTIAGSLQSQTFNGHTNNNDGWEMRNGFAGLVANGIIYNTGDSPTTGRQGIDLAGGGAINFEVGDNADNGLLAVAAVTCDDVRGIPSAPSDEATALANGGSNIGCDGVNDAGFGLLAEDTSFDPTGLAGKLGPALGSFDLRPSSVNSTMTGGVNTGPDPTATYRGAYEATAAKWTDGWTAFSMAGMTPVPEPGLLPGLMAGALGLLVAGRRR